MCSNLVFTIPQIISDVINYTNNKHFTKYIVFKQQIFFRKTDTSAYLRTIS